MVSAMTRYFFHLRRGQILIEDWEGDEFGSLEAATTEAVKAAKELAIAAIRIGQAIDGDIVEICRAETGKAGEVRLCDMIPLRRLLPGYRLKFGLNVRNVQFQRCGWLSAPAEGIAWKSL